jgi:hypothetical protein
VTYEDLFAEGLDLNRVPTSAIALTSQGQSIPVNVVTQQGSKFGPGSYIEFYGVALDTLYTATNVYQLQVDPDLAVQATTDHHKAHANDEVAAFYMETITLNENNSYAFNSTLDDPWYDTMLIIFGAPRTWTFDLQVEDLVQDPAASATLHVEMYGITEWFDTDPDHHVVASFNGTQVYDALFDGPTPYPFAVALQNDELQEGANSLELTMPSDLDVDWDVVNFEGASLTYPRAFVTRNGVLTFTASGEAFSVDNLPSPNVIVYRIDADGMALLDGVEVMANNGFYTATFPGSADEATYAVYAESALLTPAAIVPAHTEDITDGTADFLMISHPDFIDGLAPLVEAREAQGYAVRVVNVEDVYAHFGYDIFDPQPIDDYIAYAVENMGVEYVLLVGGDSFDYRNYVVEEALSFIPSPYAATDQIVRYTPADQLLADVDGDSVPDVPLGRFPVRNSEELAAIVGKTLLYQEKDYGQTAVFAADREDRGVSFTSDSESFINQLPAGWSVERAYLDDMSVFEARSTLVNSINDGVALTSFIGHSSYTIWTFQGLFNTNHAAALQNEGKPTVVVQFGCWNTYYVAPRYNTMGHKFLLSGDQGAAAVLGATTLTQSDSERAMGQQLMPLLVQPGMTIGDAMVQAKIEMAETNPEALDVIIGWTILGDPTLVVSP